MDQTKNENKTNININNLINKMPIDNNLFHEIIKNDTLNNIFISSIWGAVRYINWIEKLSFKWLILSILISWSLWYWMYWIITNLFWITDPAIISSLSFTIWILAREIINSLIKIAPSVIPNIINSVIHILSKWSINNKNENENINNNKNNF